MRIQILPVLGLAMSCAAACGDPPTLANGDSHVPDSSTDATIADATIADATTLDGGISDAGQPMDGSADASVGLELSFTNSPVANLPTGARFAGSISYGPDSQQLIDAFLPATNARTSAVIFIHGGGFTGGSRTSVYAAGTEIRRVLTEGIAWIGVDYRLLLPVGQETEGVRKSLRDSRRAVQFIRHHAAAFNIDPNRIGIYGGSAGAGTGLWLAFSPDEADANSQDPISRESTRVQVAAVAETQGTYDLLRWAPDIFAPVYPEITTEQLLSNSALAGMVVRFYGLPAALVNDATALTAALNTSEMIAYRNEVDLLDLCSSDDPPTYINNAGPNNNPLTGDFLHHPTHARALHLQCVSSNLRADIPAFNISTSGDIWDFLFAVL